MRRSNKYTGSMVVGGYTLRTRKVVFQGKEWTVPEHITPIELKNKQGVINYSTWQVRSSKPWKAIKDLDEAIEYLSKDLQKNPPKQEVKFVSKEIDTKIFKTGAAGIYFQSKLRGNRNCKEIDLNLTFKRHNLSLYLGTENTANNTIYLTAFKRLFVIRKWLENKSHLHELDWMNDNKKIHLSIESEIPESFRIDNANLAELKINYQGLHDYIDSLIKIDSMKNITEHYEGYYEVRINRNNELHRRVFKKSEFGTAKTALREAEKWRDEKLSNMGGPDIDRMLGGYGRNHSTGINGVAASFKSKHEYSYLKFIAHYRDDNRKPKSKEFSAGNVEKLSKEKEIKTFKIALLFRLDYEFHRANKKPFLRDKLEYSQYKNWSPEELERRFTEIGINQVEVEKYVRSYMEQKTK